MTFTIEGSEEIDALKTVLNNADKVQVVLFKQSPNGVEETRLIFYGLNDAGTLQMPPNYTYFKRDIEK